MGIVPVMWGVWGVLVLSMVGVSLYSARLGQNEEDQLFLADSSSHVKSEQEQIASRLNKIQPLKRTVLALTGAMTLLVLLYYVMDAIKQLR